MALAIARRQMGRLAVPGTNEWLWRSRKQVGGHKGHQEPPMSVFRAALA